MPVYAKHAAALKSALKDVGEHEVPMGSNTGPRVRAYQAATWLGGTGWPWCCAFCVYHADKSGGFNLPYRGAGAYAWYDWAKDAGWTVPYTASVPGDFVVWNLGAGHMSMLREVPKGAIVKTVDGNVSDSVDLRERPLSQVRGFIHLPEKPVVPAPSAKPPVFEVATSESGHKRIYVSGARAIGKRLPRFLERHPLGVTIKRRSK